MPGIVSGDKTGREANRTTEGESPQLIREI